MRTLKNKLFLVLNSKLFSIVIILFMAVIFFTQADHKFGYTSKSSKEDTCILSDGTAYYAYLPQYIVYYGEQKFHFTNEVDKRHPGKNFFSMLKIDPETNRVSNKFYIGTPLMQSPFYFVAHKVHQWNDWEADGYQLGYRFSIQLAALFYWLIGVFALFKLFTRFHFSRFSILAGIVVISLGTNLNYYISFVPTMSHVYSFAMVACFLNVSHRWVQKNENMYLLLAFFLIGLVTVIRPVNFLVILIVPFFFESLNAFLMRLKEMIFKKWIVVLASISLFILPIFLNVLVTYDQFGKFGLYTYADEGFSNALHPQFLNVLFSYHKGFFVYAPALFSLFVALYFFVKKAKRYFVIGWFFCVLIWLYAISSWWCWDYGGGLGMRALIELLPLFLFPLLFLFKFGRKLINGLVVIISIAGIGLYQIFQIQYNNSIIDCCKMDQTQFWNVFLKTDDRFRWMVDYDRKREDLEEIGLKQDVKLTKINDRWKVIERLPQSAIYIEESNPVFLVDSLQYYFKAKITGSVLLNDKKINPFVNVEYYKKDEFVEQTILTIGSLIENPFEQETFSIEINHSIQNKGCDKVIIKFLDGGGTPIYKQLSIIKYL